MLEVESLSVSYGRHRAVENVSLKISKGEVVVMLGANGAGKSTLLRSIAGLTPSREGSKVTIDGREITRAQPHNIVEAGIALVPEDRGLFAEMTVRENLLLGAHPKRAKADEKRNLDQLHTLFPKLSERANQVVRTMSGGERQMVAIGRALMSAPTILMLDEPSLGLSPLLCSEMFKSFRNIRETGVGVLLVEQNARQSLAIADRGYVLENGHMTKEGDAQTLMHDPHVEAAYLGGGGANVRVGADAS